MFFLTVWTFLLMYSYATITTDIPVSSCVHYNYGSFSNQGNKNFFEDRIVQRDSKPNQLYIAGVLDGHSGDTVVKLVLDKLNKYAAQGNKPDEKSITQLFQTINTELRFSDKVTDYDGGSTASLGFIDDAEIYCAQLGDSRIINSKGELVLNTHTPYNTEEVKRVEECNGYIEYFDGCYRLNGKLAVTRSFGDFHSATNGLSAKPEIKKITLDSNDFVIFATDGITDELNSTFIAEHVKERLKAEKNLNRIAKELSVLASFNCSINPNGSLPNIIKQELLELKNKMITMTCKELERSIDINQYLKEAYDNQAVVIVHRDS